MQILFIGILKEFCISFEMNDGTLSGETLFFAAIRKTGQIFA